MYPDKQAYLYSRQQRGSMLVIALFVIVVMAFLGLTLTQLLSSSNDKVIYEVLGQRAMNAARAGIECRIADTFPIAGAQAYCTSAQDKQFNNVPGLENCGYHTTVTNKTVQDGSTTLSYYQFSSTGQCQVGNVVVSRTVYIDAIQ